MNFGRAAEILCKRWTSDLQRVAPKLAVVLRDGRVVAVGPVSTTAAKKTRIPPKALIIDCRGKVVMPGFSNSHVHFTESHWNGASTAPSG